MMKQENSRNEKGIQIFSEAQNIRKIGKNNYRVLSQSQDKFYNVRKLQNADVWTCDCPDFLYRLTRKDDKRCKHIISCELLQNTVEQEHKIEKIDVPKICPKCDSTTMKKIGFRTVKKQFKRQRWECKQCHHKFTLHDSGFASMRFSPQVITESLNLFMSGMSYRNIARHIKSVHDVSVTHVAVLEWVKKYMGIIRKYVDNLKPELGDVWSLDEMMLNVKGTKPTGKGFYSWVWTIIDPKTRFVLAVEVSKRREIADARKIIASGKEVSKPSYVITDSLQAYKEAIRKELDSKNTAHIQTKSLTDGFQNRPIERYHNEIREKLKARRGLGNDESAKRFTDAYRIYHNYVRPHTGLEANVTPAEASGIDLNLGNDKIKDLITKSAESKCNFAVQLGKRIEKVSIVNEKDCVKVIPKGWMEKPTWREVNDILRLNTFSWLSNGKDSCWIKLLS
ncbi:MAG: DDE-type integrase/transposase/recombinase [Nitrosotalea sp.]